jgi:hypothetical protein
VTSGALASLPAFIDLRLNAGAGTFDVALPGGTVLLSGQAYTPAALNPLLSISGSSVANAGIGKTVSCSFVTSAPTILVGPVTAGFTDICGNPIN